MEHCVFVHTNARQMVGALVSAYSMRRSSARPEAFDVRIISTDVHPFLRRHEGEPYLRDGRQQLWRGEDLQSFTPLRFMPPELMGYRGRAVVVDPDVFAVGDVWQLLSRDMGGKALMCRPRKREKGRDRLASSVMLLDCAKLEHWRCEERFEELFEQRIDYADWINLRLEPRESIGLLEDEWNDFDRLTEHTKLLHNTNKRTQPWKTGLAVDFRESDRFRVFPPRGWIRRARRAVFGDYALEGRYQPHPDPRQQAFFFSLLRESLEAGVVDESRLREEMRLNYIRHDALELLARIESEPPTLRSGEATSNGLGARSG